MRSTMIEDKSSDHKQITLRGKKPYQKHLPPF